MAVLSSFECFMLLQGQTRGLRFFIWMCVQLLGILTKQFKCRSGTWTVTISYATLCPVHHEFLSFPQLESHTTTHTAMCQPVRLTQAATWLDTWACGVLITSYKYYCNFILRVFFPQVQRRVVARVLRLGLCSQERIPLSFTIDSIICKSTKRVARASFEVAYLVPSRLAHWRFKRASSINLL